MMKEKYVVNFPRKREWYHCPNCGRKLAIYDNAAKSNGVYLLCKECGKEIEIKI